jgi:tripartite ATP-independent transporter DctP family solute receptor
MMLKKSRCLILAMALVLVVVSCTTFAAKKPIKVIYGSVFAAGEDFVKADQYFKKIVEQKSKGQILVEYYPHCQLGSAAEMYQAIMAGAQQMVSSSLGDIVPFYSACGTFDLPYLYRDQKHLLKVAARFTSLTDQNNVATKIGMRIVSLRIRAPRHLNTKFPVNKLEDIKGRKMRVPQSPVSMDLWKALGATPIVLPGSELLTSLATGVVEASENPLEVFYKNKFWELANYCALTAHKRELVPVVVDNNWWKTLTKTQKRIITGALDKSAQMVAELVGNTDAQYKELLVKEGMQFTQPDLVPFRKKAKTIWSKYGDQKLIKKIQAIK